MIKTEVEIKRPDGTVETVDFSDRFRTGVGKNLLQAIREATQNAGRGYVRKAIMTYEASNLDELQDAYRRTHNEGGYGFVPNDEYFESLPEYRTWTERKIVL